MKGTAVLLSSLVFGHVPRDTAQPSGPGGKERRMWIEVEDSNGEDVELDLVHALDVIRVIRFDDGETRVVTKTGTYTVKNTQPGREKIKQALAWTSLKETLGID
jgi:hypothetical protein